MSREKLLKGANALCDVVKITIGPKGRNVVIANNGNPIITNDGVTVANAFKLDDASENLGVEILRQASRQTNQTAGDGTTSAIVLANEILVQANKRIAFGESPVTIKEQLLCDAKKCTDYVNRFAKKCNTFESLLAVTTNSCASKTDGELVARAIDHVGTDGVVIIEENTHGTMELSFTDGMEAPITLASPYFAQDVAKLESTLVAPTVIIKDEPVTSINPLIEHLESARENGKPLVIIAHNFTPEVVSALVINRVRGGIDVTALCVNSFDASVLLGDIGALGQPTKIIAGMQSTKFISSSIAQTRIEQIRAQIAKSKDEYMTAKLRERLAKLTTGIAKISVGCATPIETHERKLRLDDALHAGLAARRNGIVAGGGVTYTAIAKILDPNSILAKSLPVITKQICENADIDKTEFLKNLGDDVIDPALVIKSVIQNATSVAATLVTTEAIVL